MGIYCGFLCLDLGVRFWWVEGWYGRERDCWTAEIER